MVTWIERPSGGFITSCGEYTLNIYKWSDNSYSGHFQRLGTALPTGQTGDKTNIDDAKNALMDLVFAQIGKDVAAQSRTIAEFWELKRSTERDELCADEKPETRTVRELIDAGYVQTSSKYRTLSRLPPGKTALEALEARYPEQARHVREQCDRIVKSRALSLLGQFDRVELTPAQFAEFKRLQGPVA